MGTKHILTWNVDWFRNGKRSGKPNEYLEKDSSIEVYNSIKNIIQKFLENNDAIVFLQEVPLKLKVKGNKWHNHFLFDQLLKDFPEESYDIFINKVYVLRGTIGIAKKNIFKKADIGTLADNRTIAVQKDESIYIGTHMPTDFECNDDDCKKWINLLSFVKTKKESKIIICGDFNAYVGCHCKLTETYYRELLNHMKNFVDESKYTYIGQTSIDKILLSNTEKKILVNEIKLQDSFQLSDHKYIIAEIDD